MADSARRRVIVFSNGLTAILQRHTVVPLAAVRVYVRGGSAMEGPWTGTGISHLLEHVLTCDGTARRGEAELLALGDSVGGLVNAYTCCDHICHHALTGHENLATVVGMFADYVTCPRLSQAVFDRELGVVQRELERDRDDPETRLEEMLHEVMYRGHPMQYPVIGHPAGLVGLRRDDVVAYYERTHIPDNIVVVIAGDIDLEEAASVVAGAFSGWSPKSTGIGDLQPPSVLPLFSSPVGPKRAIRVMDVESVSLSMAWPTVREGEADDVLLDLLSTVLAEGDGSRLVKTLRWDRGLVHDVGAGHDSTWHTPGMFYVSAQCDAKQLEPVREVVLELFSGLDAAPISPAELQRSKRQLLADLWYQRETAEGLAAQSGEDFLATGNVDYFDSYVDRIDRSTVDDLMRVARQYLRPYATVLAAVVPPGEVQVRREAEQCAGQGRQTAKPQSDRGWNVGQSGARPATTADSRTVAAAESRTVATADSEECVRSVFDCGLTCVVRPMPESRFVAAGVYFLGGLLAETPHTNGVFNMMSQCLPRGTTRRSGERIAEAFADCGSGLRSGSGLNQFGCGFVSQVEDFEGLLSVLAEVVLAPAFDPAEVAKLKPAMLDAIARADEDWQSELTRFVRRSFFKFSPYRMSGLGTRASILAIGTAELKATHARFMCPGRGALAIAGRVDPVMVRDTVAALFAQAGARAADVVPKVQPEPSQEKDYLFIKQTAKDRQVAGVFVGFPGLSLSDRANRAAVAVLETMLAGYSLPSGRLYAALRGGDRDMAYEVSGASLTGVLPGYIGFSVGCEPGRVEEVYRVIRGQIAAVSRGDFDEAEVDRARNMIVAGELDRLQSPGGVSARMGVDEVLGLGATDWRVLLEEVKAVTKQEAISAAQQHFRFATIVVTTPKPAAAESILQ